MKKLVSSILVVLAISIITPSSLAAPQFQKPVQKPAPSESDLIKWRIFGLSDAQINQAISEGKSSFGNLAAMEQALTYQALPRTSESFIYDYKPHVSIITPITFIRAMSTLKASQYEDYTLAQARASIDPLVKNKWVTIEVSTLGNKIDYLKFAQIVLQQSDKYYKPVTIEGKDVMPDYYYSKSGYSWSQTLQAKFSVNELDVSKPFTVIYDQNTVEKATYALDFRQLK